MKYKLDETDLKNLEKVREYTSTAYYPDKEGCMNGEDMFSIIDELLREIEYLEEEKREIEQDRDENYKPAYRDEYDYYGVSRKDFY